jgi:hypothetical protein
MGTDISGWLPVGLVNSADIKTGTAVYNWTTASSNTGQYTVGIVVGYFAAGVYTGYYTRNSSDDDQIINIYHQMVISLQAVDTLPLPTPMA